MVSPTSYPPYPWLPNANDEHLPYEPSEAGSEKSWSQVGKIAEVLAYESEASSEASAAEAELPSTEDASDSPQEEGASAVSSAPESVVDQPPSFTSRDSLLVNPEVAQLSRKRFPIPMEIMGNPSENKPQATPKADTAIDVQLPIYRNKEKEPSFIDKLRASCRAFFGDCFSKPESKDPFHD
jgi:hypothetical protein